MRTRLVLAASAATVVLAGCGSTSSTASAPTTTVASGSASTAPPTTVAAKAVTAQVFSPERGSHRHTPEQIVRKLREGDRLLNEGKGMAEVLRSLEIMKP